MTSLSLVDLLLRQQVLLWGSQDVVASSVGRVDVLETRRVSMVPNSKLEVVSRCVGHVS